MADDFAEWLNNPLVPDGPTPADILGPQVLKDQADMMFGFEPDFVDILGLVRSAFEAGQGKEAPGLRAENRTLVAQCMRLCSALEEANARFDEAMVLVERANAGWANAIDEIAQMKGKQERQRLALAPLDALAKKMRANPRGWSLSKLQLELDAALSACAAVGKALEGGHG